MPIQSYHISFQTVHVRLERYSLSFQSLISVIWGMELLDHLFNYLHKHRKTIQLLIGLAIVFVILATKGLQAQSHEGFIYGKVYTSGNVYTGQIRWGTEEAYWNDHFNASKVSNPYEAYKKNQKENSSWNNLDWRLSSIWEDKSSGTIHQFGCQFGDIKELLNYGGERLMVVLKNGQEIKLSGSGYNDVGGEIIVYDIELGKIAVSWARMERIEFLPTPKKIENIMGEPLYGLVETYRKGAFTGFVQWDHDERIGADKLDGRTRDGNVSIEFDKIQKIAKATIGSDVVLYSGREFFMTGSNDVNNGNRGIIITVDGVGKIDVPWSEFKSVTFEKAKSSGDEYSAYKSPKGLFGTVYSYDDKQYKGKIIFDLDEEWEVEFLEGKDDEVEYKIPMRNIKSILPKNYNYSTVKLRNGNELLLGDGRDVSQSNAGVLIFNKGNEEPTYIEWRDVTEIVFD